jgi:hypothetical protein
MAQRADHCPACGRAFQSILDFPHVRILAFERLPLPEAVDYLSPAAAAKTMERRRESLDPSAWEPEGINRTPQIARACDTPEVRKYLARLATMSGQEVEPRGLLPPFKASGRFKWACPVGDTGIYLSLTDAEVQPGDKRTAEVQVYCDGPNLGSAGGPTLQRLGAIARLHYQGLLAEGFRAHLR